MDGLEICRRIKSGEKLKHIPVIMVTAKGEESDIVIGLGIGADDYVAKPFSPRELVARVNAAIRRSGISDKQGRPDIVELEGLIIDERKFSVTYHGNLITSVGFFRSFLSGGNLSGDDVSQIDAMLLPFEGFFKKTLF